MITRLITSTISMTVLSVATLLGQNRSDQTMKCPHCPHCQGTMQESNTSQKQNTTQKQLSQNQGSFTSLSGEILSMRSVNLRSDRGEPRRHVLAQIQLNSGQRKTVDLGITSTINRLGLQRGDYIQVRGPQKSLSGRPVLMAQQIRYEGRIYNLNRGSASLAQSRPANPSGQFQRSSSSQSTSSTPVYDLSGRIEGFKHLNLRNAMGQRGQHSLVRITLQNGRTAVIDLGPKRNLDRIDFQKGDRIQVQGQRGRVDGRQVLMANQLRVGGQTIRINRSTQIEQAGNFKIQGTVEGYQLTTVGTGTNQLAILKLRLLDGRSVLIDAGQQYNVGEFNLKDLNLMDKVTIEGKRKTVQGRQILVANTIEFEKPAASSGRQFVRERQSSSSKQASQSTNQSNQDDSQSGQSDSQ